MQSSINNIQKPLVICITGPESTGKSTLTKLLAKHFSASWVKEYAREYLEQLSKPYQFNDVLKMAEIQLQNEQNGTKNNNLIFLDTDLTVFKVWINEKYNRQVEWIEHEIQQSSNKLYLLCNIDIPWQPDPLREHPNLIDRERIFNQYIDVMKQHNFNYHIISGTIENRLHSCIQLIENLIQNYS